MASRLSNRVTWNILHVCHCFPNLCTPHSTLWTSIEISLQVAEIVQLESVNKNGRQLTMNNGGLPSFKLPQSLWLWWAKNLIIQITPRLSLGELIISQPSTIQLTSQVSSLCRLFLMNEDDPEPRLAQPSKTSHLLLWTSPRITKIGIPEQIWYNE